MICGAIDGFIIDSMLSRPIISRFGRLGLQRRIMLYVTGGLMVVMAAYSAVSLQAIRQSNDLVFRERLMVAGTVAQQIDSELSHLRGELNDMGETVGKDLANNQQAEARQAMQGLRQHWSAYDHFSSPCAIILTDPKGVVVWSDPPPSELLSADFSSRPSFRAALQSLQPSVADEISPGADGHGSLWMATPILVSGRIEGVLLGELNLSEVSQSFTPLLKMDEPGYSLELIDGQGMVLASQQPERQWTLSEHYPLLKDLLARRQAGTGTHQMPASSSKPTHIVAFAPLRDVPWGVTLEEPQDLALTLPHALENRFLLFGTLVLLTGLVLAWVTTRAVVQPVNALIDETQHIAAGNLDHSLDVTAEDEVGRLARSFDEMRVELKQSRKRSRAGTANWKRGWTNAHASSAPWSNHRMHLPRR